MGPAFRSGSGPVRPWNLLESLKVYEATPWVTVHKDTVRLPGGRVVDDYFRVDLPEYVMIYPRFPDGKVLCVRQYRHAAGRVLLTLPTGCLMAGEPPLAAARRELLEETGYEAEVWKPAGAYQVDGNKGCGKAHFFIAEGLVRVGAPVQDDMEESQSVFVPEDFLRKQVVSGEPTLLAVAALVALVSIPAPQEPGRR